MKKRLWLRLLLGIAAAVLLALAALVAYLTVTEYRPAARQDAELAELRDGDALSIGEQMTICSWNIGYAGLDAGADFFMDGGSTVNPAVEDVAENLAAIREFIASQPADAWLLQEVDVNSARTSHIDELAAIAQVYPGSHALAYNYKCDFVPFPLPPIGRVESGIATLTNGCVKGSFERIALPCPFSWPVSAANLKRCLLVARLEVEGSARELVLVNLHLEAYDDGQGKIAQTRLLMEFLQQEYEKGNYVIAGGDFNQTFDNAQHFGGSWEGKWTPGVFSQSALPEGVRLVYDATLPTCRSLDQVYTGDRQNHTFYLIDGFIVTDNVQVDAVHTIDLDFAASDHNPMLLEATLL